VDAFPLDLSWQRPASQLPAPLPTSVEVRESEDVFSVHRGYRTVVRVGLHFAVKYGHDIEAIEGGSMLLVRTQSNARIPEIYAIFTESDVEPRRQVVYNLMQYIPGNTLISIWSDLNDEAKRNILAQLRDSVDAIQQIPNRGYHGHMGNRRYIDEFFITVKKETVEEECRPRWKDRSPQ
jgi:hypothetical protein